MYVNNIVLIVNYVLTSNLLFLYPVYLCVTGGFSSKQCYSHGHGVTVQSLVPVGQWMCECIKNK